MADRLHLQPKHREVLEALLREHLPDVEVWAYGSRVSEKSHDGSDLDLVLRGPGLKEFPISQLGDFEEAVRESIIPFLVEARDWARLPERFHREIERDHVVLVKGRLTSKNTCWRETTLSQLGRIVTGKTPPSHNSGYFDGHIPFVTPTDFDGRRRILSTKRYLSEAGANAVGNVVIPKDTVMVSCIGSDMGKSAIASCDCVTNQQINSIIIETNDSPLLVYYNLSRRKSEIRGISSGSAQPILNKSAFGRLAISLPPPSEQHAIASVLGTLDDKIELNRRMNETLEAMARALFRSWFVDFDPVRAKMEGRDPGLPEPLAELFPGRVVDSALGEIPEGWTHDSVYEFAKVIYGAPFASKQFNSEKCGVPLIRIRDLATHEPGVSTEQIHRNGHLIAPGDIVVGMDGEFRLHIWKGPKARLNQRVCHFEPVRGVPTAYLAEALREPLMLFERGKVGTTVIHLGKSDIDTFHILQPGPAALNAFGRIAEPLLDSTVENSLESRTLAQTRDLLLSKLISGEIRIREAERIVEAVA